RHPAIGLAAVQIGEAELVLCLGVALLGGAAKPYRRVAEAADDAFAPGVAQPQPKLALGIAAPRRLGEALERTCPPLAGDRDEPGANQPIGAAAARAVGGQQVTAHASPRSCPAPHR